MRTLPQPGTVLIVGSSPGGLTVARNALARAGHRVVTSHALLEGLRLVREVCPEVLILDDLAAQMPIVREFTRRGPNGMRAILSVPRGRGAELLTATIAEQAWPMAQVVAVIEKPYDGDALVSTVRGDWGGSEPVTDTFELPYGIVNDLADCFTPTLHQAMSDVTVMSEPPELPDAPGDPILHARIGLVPVDQLLQVAEQMTAVCCRLEHQGEIIEIFFRNRRITFAHRLGEPLIGIEPSRGELIAQTEALVYEVLGWRTGSVELLGDPVQPQEAEAANISLPLAPLLLEGMVRLDERQRSGSTMIAEA